MPEPLSAAVPEPPVAFPHEVRARWMLDPALTYLNHGCFGARLRSVFEMQQACRERFEANPVEILDRLRDGEIHETKIPIGAFLGMKPADFGFVTNATDGVNAVLGSLSFEPGDEVVTTNHVYNAVRKTMDLITRRVGATMVEVDVPMPIASPEQMADVIMAGVTDRTRLLIIDHVTSPTAVLVPVDRIIAACHERGIDVLVDGAHAPGMLDLDVEAVGAAYYTGNLHKWVCAPPGAAFLWVRPDRQDGIHPTVISHFLDEGLAAEFNWQGTRDISAWMMVETALEQVGGLASEGGWARIREHNHALATWAQAFLTGAWDVPPNTPADGSMLGSMTAITVPERARDRFQTPEAIGVHLFDEWKIEVPVFAWRDRWVIRPSCQVYNTPDQYERLAEAMLTVL